MNCLKVGGVYTVKQVGYHRIIPALFPDGNTYYPFKKEGYMFLIPGFVYSITIKDISNDSEAFISVQKYDLLMENVLDSYVAYVKKDNLLFLID